MLSRHLSTWRATSSSTLLSHQSGQGRDLMASWKSWNICLDHGPSAPSLECLQPLCYTQEKPGPSLVMKELTNRGWVGSLQKRCRSVGTVYDNATLWQPFGDVRLFHRNLQLVGKVQRG